MELGIKGHPTRGDEVIKLLESLGGKNSYSLTGCCDNQFYIMDNVYIMNNVIYSLYIGPDEIKGYKIFSLEDFLEKYPYKVGDKVNIYVQNDDIEGWFDMEVAEITSMRWDPEHCRIVYKMEDIDREFCVEDIKGKVDEEQQIDPTIDYVEIVKKSYEEEAGKRAAEITMDTLYKTGITHEYLKERGFNLPDGYHFTDENGNVIGAKKIKLVKNTPYYPKSYEECCDVLSMDYATHYNLRYFTYERGFYEYATTDKLCSLQDKLNILGKLIICRDAYWKIAGEYLDLDKPWEPDFDNLSTTHEFIKISKGCFYYSSRLLVFPTIEMRDAFYNNFKFLIELCKELL